MGEEGEEGEEARKRGERERKGNMRMTIRGSRGFFCLTAQPRYDMGGRNGHETYIGHGYPGQKTMTKADKGKDKRKRQKQKTKTKTNDNDKRQGHTVAVID